MKKYLIVTNNHLVNAEDNELVLVDGDFKDVLNKVRDYVHTGYGLLTHPLPASIRMFHSPVRSILISHEEDINSIEFIESSIEKYDQILGKREPDYNNLADYEKIDLELLESSFEELTWLNSIDNKKIIGGI